MIREFLLIKITTKLTLSTSLHGRVEKKIFHSTLPKIAIILIRLGFLRVVFSGEEGSI